MTHARRCRVVLVALALFGAAACGSEDEVTATTTEAGGDPTTTARSPGDETGTVEELEELTTVLRSMAPTGSEGESTGRDLVVAEGIDELWDDWGPTNFRAPDPPDVPDGHVVVAFWNRGYVPVLHSWRLDGGQLVLIGESEVPGGSCVVPAVVDAHTVVVAIDDDRVVPGMPIAEPEIDVRTIDC